MEPFILYPLIITAVALLIKIYVRLTIGWCKSQVCLVGKTVIVTGANTGVGYEAALDFAKRGARVILACRNEEKARNACSKIIEETDNKNVHYKIVDFASFESVRAFAKEINETEERLDILVNNAGASELGNKRTKDGHVILMQVNYFSSFLLTNLLIDLLKKSGPSRIVNVASMVAKLAFSFDVNKLDVYYPHFGDYYHSKLCNVLFTMELAERLKGTEVTTYSLHPGFVATEIFRNIRGVNSVGNSLLLRLYAKNSEEGAQTTIHCSLAKGIEKYSGGYFTDCKVQKPFYLMTKDPGLPKKLWKKTEELLKLGPGEMRL